MGLDNCTAISYIARAMITCCYDRHTKSVGEAARDIGRVRTIEFNVMEALDLELVCLRIRPLKIIISYELTHWCCSNSRTH